MPRRCCTRRCCTRRCATRRCSTQATLRILTAWGGNSSFARHDLCRPGLDQLGAPNTRALTLWVASWDCQGSDASGSCAAHLRALSAGICRNDVLLKAAPARAAPFKCERWICRWLCLIVCSPHGAKRNAGAALPRGSFLPDYAIARRKTRVTALIAPSGLRH
jgi:hypothetical protein